MTDRPKQPIFDLSEHFEAEVKIGPEAHPNRISIPIKVKRFTKQEMEEFTRDWESYVESLGDDTKLSAEERKERDRKSLKFFEDRIRECITLEPGYIRDKGKDVVDGAGLLGVFHSNHAILGQFVGQIWLQNSLVGVIAKNLKSPLGSVTGSTASVLTNGDLLTGAEPESAAQNAASRDSASSEPVEASPVDRPSGPTPPVH